MAEQNRGGLQGFKDKLQAKRNIIFYGLAVCTLFLALASWALLPDQVGMQFSHGKLMNFVDKNTAILAHMVLGLGFGGLFWRRPRELVYLIASVLGILLALGVLVSNLGLV